MVFMKQLHLKVHLTKVTIQNETMSFLLPNPGHKMPAPSFKVGKSTSAHSPSLDQDAFALSSKLLGLDATVPDHSWAQSRARPVSLELRVWIEPNI
jgi:hypothetical protein